MNSPLALVGLVGAIIGVSLLVAFLLSRTGLPVTQWVPIGLSVASIVIAVLSAFKADLFDFALRVVGGDLALVHSSEPNYKNSGVVLPLHFANRGYGEGIVLGLAVEVLNHRKGDRYLMTPIAEVDIQKLIQNTGRIHGSNILGPFYGFPVASRQVVSKWFAFGWVNNNSKYAQPHLEPGIYTFDVFVTTDRQKDPTKTLTFSQEFSKEQIDSFIKGSAIYLLRSNPFEPQ